MWQALVQDDDVRVPHGKAHENARSIVEDHNGLPKITAAIKGNSITNSRFGKNGMGFKIYYKALKRGSLKCISFYRKRRVSIQLEITAFVPE